MKYLSLLLFIGIIFYSCSSLSVKNGSAVKTIEKKARATISYKSYNFLQKSSKKQAELEMWSKDKFKKFKKSIPKGGMIVVNIEGITVDTANLEWWSYVVKDLKGNEIKRQKGEKDTPEYTVSDRGTIWWNIDIIRMEKEISSPFQVFVIDKLLKKRSSFVVYPNQTEIKE